MRMFGSPPKRSCPILIGPRSQVRFILTHSPSINGDANSNAERKPLKSRPPTIVVEPAAPQNKLSSAVRSVLGSRSNLPPSSSPKRPPATKTGSLTANGNGSEKENVPPKLIRKKASKSVVKDSSITPPLPPPPSTQEVGVGASPLAVQEAAGNRVDRVAGGLPLVMLALYERAR